MDGVWHTRNIVPTPVSMCPYKFGAVYHREHAVDFQVKSILDDLALSPYLSNKIRLRCSFLIIAQRFLERAEAQFNLHKITTKIHQLKEQWHTLDPLSIEVLLYRIDEKITDLLVNAKKLRIQN